MSSVHGLGEVMLRHHLRLLEVLRERLLLLHGRRVRVHLGMMGLHLRMGVAMGLWMLMHLKLSAALLVVASSTVHATIPPILDGIVAAAT